MNDHEVATVKKYVVYDHSMENFSEYQVKEKGSIAQDLKNKLDQCVLFLNYGNTYYYRSIGFLKG